MLDFLRRLFARPQLAGPLQRLAEALRANARDDMGILMDRHTTEFRGLQVDLTDDMVIDLVKSVPTHY